MTDKKISQLTGATTPLGGTEEVPLVQSSTTKKVSVDNLTKGRVVNALTFDTDVAAAGVTLTGTTLAADGTDTNIDINLTPKGTGEVNITKVDIDAGAIDGTAIGVNSKASGAFTTLETSDDINVGNGKNISLNASSSGSTTRLQWKYTGTPYAWIERVNSTGDMAFGVQSSEAMRLTSTLLQISKNDRANGAVLRITNSAESSAWVSGDVIGDIDFYSSDSSDPDVRSRIRSVSSTVGPNTNPTSVDLTFSTFASSALTERMRLDYAGNLGLDVTPSAWNTTEFKAFQVGVGGSFYGRVQSGDQDKVGMSANAFFDQTDTRWEYIATDPASRYDHSNGGHYWYTAPSGTAGTAISWTQAMTLDASGNLLLGETSRAYVSRFTLSYDAVSTNGPIFLDTRTYATNVGGSVWLGGKYNTAGNYRPFAGVSGKKENATDGNSAGYLQFLTNGNIADPTERARIDSSGRILLGTTSILTGVGSSRLQVAQGNTADYVAAFVHQTGTTASNYGLYVKYANGSPNGTSNVFLSCADSSTTRATIRSNGGLANYQSNNVDLSDVRTKKDITPAPSYWDKIGALEIVTYKYNDQSHDDVNVGVIAQQVEAVEPVWVDSDGFGETPEGEEPLKTVYTKDITFAAIKALQEAMTRIEALEAEVAALKGAN